MPIGTEPIALYLRHLLQLTQVFVPCHQVNLKAHHVDYNRFYIPDITSLVDIQEDYLKWFLSKAEIVSPDVVSLPCCYA